MEGVRDAVYLEDLMRKGEEIKYDERGRILYYKSHEVSELTIPKHWDPDKICRHGRPDSKIHSSDCASDFAISAQRMKHNATASPFFRLPLEIRNQIYAIVFNRAVFYIHCHDHNHWETTCKDEPKTFRFKKGGVSLLGNGFLGFYESTDSTRYEDFPRLSGGSQQSGIHPLWPTKPWLVCKQMHHDTALVVYSKATFHFDSSTYYARRQFIENRTPAQRAAIRKLAIYLSSIDAISILEQDTAIDRYLPSVPHVLQIEKDSNIRTLTGLRRIIYHFHWEQNFFQKEEEPLIEEKLREEFNSLSEPIGTNLEVEVYWHFLHGSILFYDGRSRRN